MAEQRIGDYLLPPGIAIFERGWLSANTILMYGDEDVSLVDSGYCAHQQLTVDLVANALQQQGLKTLHKIVNTHLHSDHCGGNAALSDAFHPETWIPVAEAQAVLNWDVDLLSYQQLGQVCPCFAYQGLLVPGQEILLGRYLWQILGAPGHDHHAIMLYQADHQILISGDALWEDGFGAIFPELWGEGGFAETAQTIALIEELPIALVIPGHGKSFTEVKQAIATAKSRLDYLAGDPNRNARHGAKVLLKFKLLEWRSMEMLAVHQWIASTSILQKMQEQLQMTVEDFQEWLPNALVKSHAAKIEQGYLLNID